MLGSYPGDYELVNSIYDYKLHACASLASEIKSDSLFISSYCYGLSGRINFMFW